MYKEATAVIFSRPGKTKKNLSRAEISPLQIVASAPVTPDLDGYTCHIEHQRYRCPVYVWVSAATYRVSPKKTFQTRQCFIVYVEYRGKDRASRYVQRVFLSLAEVDHFIGQDVRALELPDIGVEMTKRYLIRQDRMVAVSG
ncbi:hypothetical protein ACWJJH_14910 [Endozoicomonadaceae bacterium StTr2]